MKRTSSKLSFWVLRPTQNKGQIHIQLPLLSPSKRSDLNNQYSHQIHSITAEYRPRQKQPIIDSLLRRYGELMDRYDVIIHPESNGLLIWNLLIFFFTFLYFIQIPIALLLVEDSFQQIYQNKTFALCYYIVMDVFVYDMLVVRPRISYEQHGKNMTKNQDILRFYLRHYFWIDFVCIIVIIVSFLPIQHIDYLRFFFMLKIIPLREINRQIKFKLLIKRFSLAFFDFLKLVFFIIFVTNFYACIYFAIDFYYYSQQGFFYQNGYLWINGSISMGYLDVLEAFGRPGTYVYALFWALETARTCGYGVATPKNYVSMLYVNFVMLTIVIIFVYFTNGVITLIITHGELRRKKLNTIKRVVDVSQQLQIERKTKNRIVQYITDFQNPQQELQEYMERSLSAALHNKFKLTFRQHFISLIQLVSKIISNGTQAELFKIDLAKIIKHRHYQPDEIVYLSKRTEQPKLFLIQRGVCTVENSEVGYRKYQSQWSIIGKREFYFQQIPIYTVIANEYLQGLEVTRSDFISCLKRYPIFYQNFREIIDDIIVSQHGTQQFHIKCAFCNNYHLHEHCAKVNNWRTELRIKNIANDEGGYNQRKQTSRRTIRNIKTITFYLKAKEMEKVYRTSDYFTHYNI